MPDTKLDPVIDQLKKPSDFWHVIYAINTGRIVLDPDGWDRKNWEQSWGEPITWIEFQRRAAFSTQHPMDMAGQIKMLMVFEETAAELERDRIKKILLDEGDLLSLEQLPTQKPRHGNCCTCQECGHYHDECVCESNRLNKLIDE